MWECIREYISAEIRLALLRNRSGNNLAPKSVIEEVQEQSTRMETAIREMIETNEISETRKRTLDRVVIRNTLLK